MKPCHGNRWSPIRQAMAVAVAIVGCDIAQADEQNASVEAALATASSAEFLDTTLDEACQFWSELHEINVHLDEIALENAGIDKGMLLQSNLENVPLRSVLNLTLPSELGWTVRDNILIVTSAVGALIPSTQTYDVTALIDAGLSSAHLTTAIRRVLRPSTWNANGGEGIVRFVDGKLVVRHDYHTHREVSSLLSEVGRVLAKRERKPTGNRGKIETALAKTVAVDFNDTPLVDALKFLSETSKIPFHIDRDDLGDAQVLLDVPVTANVERITLKSALQLLLSPLGLQAVVAHDVLMVTTGIGLPNYRSTRVYPVADEANRRRSHQFLVSSIIAPDSWESNGGSGSAYSAGNLLIVNHSPTVHALLDDLFSKLAAHAKDDETSTEIDTRQEREAKIVTALEKQVTIEFLETPLSDATDFLGKSFGIPIWIDTVSLTAADLSPQVPVTANLAKVPLSTALTQLLESRDLAWSVEYEVLRIMSRSAADESQHIRVYPIADLLAGKLTPATLLDTISATVAPNSWQERGGRGSAQVFESALVVSQSGPGHRELAQLLEKLMSSP